MPIDIASELAVSLRLRPEQVEGSLELLDQGLSPTFIAHYRKEKTGGLDEETLARLVAQRAELVDLQGRKESLLRALREQDRLTPELEAAIDSTTRRRVVDDLALAFRPQRSTAASTAADRGLQPLAELILAGSSPGALETIAGNHIRHDREVHTTEDALTGAAHIIAERYSVSPRVRQKVRDMVWSDGVLRCSRGSVPEDQVKEFRDYFAFSESVRDLPPHRVLAVNRGERKKALKVAIEVPLEALLAQCRKLLIPQGHRFAAFLEACLKDALERLVLPAVGREVRQEITQRAQEHAIEVFANNVRGILMSPPVSGKYVLAIDPGFRTGCKAAAVDAEGRLLAETILYPHEPQRRWNEAKETLLDMIGKHRVDLVAIGNGTGCHETEKLISEVIAQSDGQLQYTLVSEAGASAYAAGELAAEEFPDLDPTLRGTVSVARRLQDPLSEFVKVDPRVIGVGLYQHDIDQQKLKEDLEAVVRAAANRVGVDVNTANVILLEKVAGLDADLARNVDAWRREHGPLKSREDLKKIPGIDDRVFLQCAGFLRVHGGDNPLDDTAIHPESYPVALKLIERFGCTPADLQSEGGLPGLRQKLEKLSLEELSNELHVGIPTLSHILLCLEHPHDDPRQANPPPIFKRQMMRLEDLRAGMWLKGAVRNVVDFGAFVDVGVNEDGLIHVSQFSRRYIKNPADFLHVGQTVDVRVLSIDHDRRRIALSMIPDEGGDLPGLGAPAVPGPAAPPS